MIPHNPPTGRSRVINLPSTELAQVNCTGRILVLGLFCTDWAVLSTYCQDLPVRPLRLVTYKIYSIYLPLTGQAGQLWWQQEFQLANHDGNNYYYCNKKRCQSGHVLHMCFISSVGKFMSGLLPQKAIAWNDQILKPVNLKLLNLKIKVVVAVQNTSGALGQILEAFHSQKQNTPAELNIAPACSSCEI